MEVTLAHPVLTSTSTDVAYLLDVGLRLRWNNPAWDLFALQNAGSTALLANPEAPITEGFVGPDRIRWELLYERLLHHPELRHQERFICPSPVTRRWFQLTVTPVLSPGGEIEGLLHRAELLHEGPDIIDPAGILAAQHLSLTCGAPTHPELRASGWVKPLMGMGGDGVWGRVHPDGVADVVMFDVMGHDTEAGHISLFTGALLDNLPRLSPGALVEELNIRLVTHLPRMTTSDTYATGIAFQLDPGGDRVIVSSFAHAQVLLARHGPVTLEPALPIGLYPKTEPWPEQELRFDEVGDRLVAFSDGLEEQFDPAGQMMGLDRLLARFNETVDAPLEECLHGILDGVEAHRGDALVKDDQTVLGIERLP